MKKLLTKFKHAFDGLFHGFVYDKSIRLQYILALLTILCFKVFFNLNKDEWLFIIIIVCIVIAFEYINSAIENLIDLVCETYNDHAKHAKDYAAAAVLIVGILSIIIAGFILL